MGVFDYVRDLLPGTIYVVHPTMARAVERFVKEQGQTVHVWRQTYLANPHRVYGFFRGVPGIVIAPGVYLSADEAAGLTQVQIRIGRHNAN